MGFTVRLRFAILLGAIFLASTVNATKVQADSTSLRVRSRSRDKRLFPEEQRKKQRQQQQQQQQQQQKPKEEEPLFDFERRNNPMSTPYSRAELDLKPCVVVRFYDKQANALPLLLFSLLASGHPNLKALVVDTGKQPYKNLPGLLLRVNQEDGEQISKILDFEKEQFCLKFSDSAMKEA